MLMPSQAGQKRTHIKDMPPLKAWGIIAIPLIWFFLGPLMMATLLGMIFPGVGAALGRRAYADPMPVFVGFSICFDAACLLGAYVLYRARIGKPKAQRH